MRILLASLALGLVLAAQSFAGVIHESKSTVKFKGLGQYTTHDIIYIQGLKQYKESSGNFEAQGMMGQMMSGLLFGPKSNAEITDLQAMKIFELFKEKKQYRELPIEKMRFDEETGRENEEQENAAGSEVNEQKNPVKITRQELRVVPTHKQKVIHGFPCREYHVFWITEWVNTETGEKGKDSLFTDVWATKKTAAIEKGIEEEAQFHEAYFKKVGLDVDMNARSILGMNWIKMFRSMRHATKGEEQWKGAQWAKEMRKIDGFPVLIDGKFFVSVSGKKGRGNQTGAPGMNMDNPAAILNQMFKGGMKQQMKPKAAKNEPAFAYHTELIRIEVKPIGAEKFKVPAGYQKIN